MTTPGSSCVRRARPDEAAALTALCKRAKAHWGYDADFMRFSEASLTIAPALIATGRVLIVQTGDGRIAGLASLAPLDGDVWDLPHMFVDPWAIGTGAGRILFEAIAALAAQSGGRTLCIQSDPNAEGFYLRMGARRAGEAPSDAIPGRMLPMLVFDLRR